MALKGIVIDPGHGGSDGGANGNGIVEKDYTLKISKYMYDRFKELGVPVSITRTTDETLSPKKRVEKIKSFYGTGNDVIVISNHLNAGGGDGAEVIYALRNNSNLSKKILNELEIFGQNIRKYYQLRLPSNSKKDYYFIHRDTPNTEAIIVEYGFVDSPKDDVSQIKNNYKKYAEAVVKAICEYKGIKYTTNTSSTNSSTYIVKKGDTLWDIAKKYNTSVSELKKNNNLKSDVIQIGQVLKLNSNNTYIVQKGDSLWALAKKFNTSINDIVNKNNLKSTTIKVGQKLII